MSRTSLRAPLWRHTALFQCLILVVSSLWATAADIVVLNLDSSHRGAGKFCPKTLPEYIEQLNTLLDDHGLDLFAETSKTVGEATSTTRFYAKRLFSMFQPISYLYEIRFSNLNTEQMTFLETVFSVEWKYSQVTDPNYQEDWPRVFANTSHLMGGIRSSLGRIEYVLFDGLPLFNREFVQINGFHAVNETCVVGAFPSVSNGWVLKHLGLATWWEVESGSILAQSSNFYPSGDRICIEATESGKFEVTVAHIFATRLGGLLGPFHSLGLFDNPTRDALREEAQLLEEKVFSVGS